MARGEDTGSHEGRQVGRSAHEDRVKSEAASRMGVPKEWVTGHSSASFTGSIVGHTADPATGHGNLWFSAESTGGGATDSHQIPFAHDYMKGTTNKFNFNKFFGVNEKNPRAGKKWTVTGTHGWDPKTQSNTMSWSIAPHKPDTE